MYILAEAEKHQEGLEQSLHRLKHKDDAHNRFMAAKAYENLKQYDRAEIQVRVGLLKDHKDLLCNLGLAALLLRRADTLDAAGRYLDLVEKAVGDATDETTKYDILTTRAIFLALSGKMENGKEFVKEVLKADPENSYAKKVLAVIEPKTQNQR